MPKMTIRECMDASLQLIDQYSIAGALVPLSYNGQADDELRMINLINDAQMQIATTSKPIHESVEFTVPKLTEWKPIEEIPFTMPEGFLDATQVYFTPLGGARITKGVGFYKWLNDDTLLLPDRPAGTYRVEYTRYPVRYPKNVDKNTELDNTPDTHVIIPYYVAAMLQLDENPKAYYACYNIWETRLARLGYKQPHAENGLVEDVYGLNRFWGVW